MKYGLMLILSLFLSVSCADRDNTSGTDSNERMESGNAGSTGTSGTSTPGGTNP